MSQRFTFLFTKDGKWFVARCVELNVVSQGKTYEEARKNIKEAVSLYLEDEPALQKKVSKIESLITTMEIQYA